VRIEDPDQVGAGYQLSVEDAAGAPVGTLTAPDSHSQISSGFANHTSTGVANSIASWVALGNAAEFEVIWQAPPADGGPAMFWVAGNAINDAGGNAGDHVYTASYATASSSDIPAASDWALIVLLILLATDATVIMGRYQRVVVAAGRCRR